jgi:heme-degrading monooxygenase HmoA
MLARVVEIQVEPGKIDECISILRDRNAPAVAAQPGFNHGHWLVDRQTGRCMSVTFWETPEDEIESRASVPGLLEKMGNVLATKDVRQEAFDVVHDQHGWEEPFHG